MSEYSDFQTDTYLCPACGAELSLLNKVQGGWQCPTCNDFIPESMAVNPYKGLSNKHKQNTVWR